MNKDHGFNEKYTCIQSPNAMRINCQCVKNPLLHGHVCCVQ